MTHLLKKSPARWNNTRAIACTSSNSFDKPSAKVKTVRPEDLSATIPAAQTPRLLVRAFAIQTQACQAGCLTYTRNT